MTAGPGSELREVRPCAGPIFLTFGILRRAGAIKSYGPIRIIGSH